MGTKEIPEEQDIDLIKRYLATRDTKHFTLLYRRYAGKVYSKCISLLKEEHLARDAAQDIFMKIFLHLRHFSEQAKFSTWVYAVTYNYCIDAIRKKKKSGDIFSDSMDHIPEMMEEVPDEVLLSMKSDRLRVVLENIPIGDKAILLMKYQDGLQAKDIADILYKTENAIKMKITRAKRKAQMVYEELYPDG